MSPRILIADDDPELLEFLRVSLGDKYEIFTVRDGLDVIRECDFLEPDIFILDALMPRFTGYQVCQILKKSEQFMNAPIIMISGKASKKDVEYVKKLGVRAFIPKPFNFIELDNVITKILEDPHFAIRHKSHECQEILKLKKNEAAVKEEKDRSRVHRETKNVMRGFIQEHRDFKK